MVTGATISKDGLRIEAAYDLRLLHVAPAGISAQLSKLPPLPKRSPRRYATSNMIRRRCAGCRGGVARRTLQSPDRHHVGPERFNFEHPGSGDCVGMIGDERAVIPLDHRDAGVVVRRDNP